MHEETGDPLPMEALPGACEGDPGDEPLLYQVLFPTSADTEIRVDEIDCLAAAQKAVLAGAKACLLLHGRVEGPSHEHKHRQSRDVLECSTFKQAYGASLQHCPKWGGIYMNRVCVYQTAAGDIKPFRVAMVYAAAVEKQPEEDADAVTVEAYLQDVREKVHGVLRICRHHGHNELILGAWGCDSLNAPPRRRKYSWPREVAKIFREALTRFAFQRVTFAILQRTALADFRSELTPGSGLFHQ